MVHEEAGAQSCQDWKRHLAAYRATPLTIASQKYPEAAVLVPISVAPGDGSLSVLLTLRSLKLRCHAGEVSFPGGKRDKDDASIVQTALREAYEEIGLPASDVEVIRELEPMLSLHGLLVTPVVAIVPCDFTAKLNTDEVEKLFRVPLRSFIEEEGHSVQNLDWHGEDFALHQLEYKRNYISGLTSCIAIHVAAIAFDKAPAFEFGYPAFPKYSNVVETYRPARKQWPTLASEWKAVRRRSLICLPRLMESLKTLRLAIIGCGMMGGSILTGLVATSSVDMSQVKATIAPEESMEKLNKTFPGLDVSHDNKAALEWANVILISVKPNMIESILTDSELRTAFEDKLVISIAAGFPLQRYLDCLPASRVIRVMPNTPCCIREGMSVFSVSPLASKADLELAFAIFSPLGLCHVVEEKHMNVVTALAGSGPAFSFLMLEALADGAVLMGLPHDVALKLAAQTMQGAARMVLQTGEHPAVLKRNVTTPAGTTAAGLLAMESGKIRSVLAHTIRDATVAAEKLAIRK